MSGLVLAKRLQFAQCLHHFTERGLACCLFTLLLQLVEGTYYAHGASLSCGLEREQVGACVLWID